MLRGADGGIKRAGAKIDVIGHVAAVNSSFKHTLSCAWENVHIKNNTEEHMYTC